MFVLYSLANQQVVTSASIRAFQYKPVEEARDRKIANAKSVKPILTMVRDVLEDSKADYYCWNYARGEWIIGYHQMENLREALGFSKKPNKP